MEKVPHFVIKLFNILEDQSLAEYIHWNDSEDGFVIEDLSGFTNEVMPRFFKHKNFSSLIRQLNMYGFQKMRGPEQENAYSNPFFLRREKELFGKIQRKGAKKESARMKEDDKKLKSQLFSIRQNQKQENLEKACQELIWENSKFLEENKRILEKFDGESKRKNRKAQQLLVYLIMARSNNQISVPHRWTEKIKDLIEEQQLTQKLGQELLVHDSDSPIIDEENDLQIGERKIFKEFGAFKPNFLSIREEGEDILYFGEDGQKDESSFVELEDFLDL